APTHLYPPSLPDALPISRRWNRPPPRARPSPFCASTSTARAPTATLLRKSSRLSGLCNRAIYWRRLTGILPPGRQTLMEENYESGSCGERAARRDDQRAVVADRGADAHVDE